MPTYPAPGVYVEYLPFASGSIRDVLVDQLMFTPSGDADSIAGLNRWHAPRTRTVFIGRAETGPWGEPVAINGLAAFQDVFGGFVDDDSYLRDGVSGFLANGGTDAIVVRMPDEPEATPPIETVPEALRPLDYSLVCAPDLLARPVPIEQQQSMLMPLLAQCEADRAMLLVDVPPHLSVWDAREWRAAVGIDSAAAACYYPWLRVEDVYVGREYRAVPNSGHVAGMLARLDAERGFHHAPANESLLGVIGLDRDIVAQDLDVLTWQGINPLRISASRGVVVWGTRTMSFDPSQRYVRHRRLLDFVSDQAVHGTEWAIFRRGAEVRERAAQDLANLFHLLWRTGALWGTSANEAYSVAVANEVPSGTAFRIDCLLALDDDLIAPLHVLYVGDG